MGTPSHDTDSVRTWITFHTSAPFVGAADAMFALSPQSPGTAVTGSSLPTSLRPVTTMSESAPQQ